MMNPFYLQLDHPLATILYAIMKKGVTNAHMKFITFFVNNGIQLGPSIMENGYRQKNGIRLFLLYF